MARRKEVGFYAGERATVCSNVSEQSAAFGFSGATRVCTCLEHFGFGRSGNGSFRWQIYGSFQRCARGSAFGSVLSGNIHVCSDYSEYFGVGDSENEILRWQWTVGLSVRVASGKQCKSCAERSPFGRVEFETASSEGNIEISTN